MHCPEEFRPQVSGIWLFDEPSPGIRDEDQDHSVDIYVWAEYLVGGSILQAQVRELTALGSLAK